MPQVGRAYETSHPWIDFQLRAEQDRLWVLLGEALSKCHHLSGTPLQPGLARSLARVYLVKGAVATTAIEGNTLREEEVLSLLDSGERLPASQEYLQQEVDNVLLALEEIRDGAQFELTPEWIKSQNRKILANLELEDHVVPGEYTQERVAVGNYRGAPPEDVDFLMDELCKWLNRDWLTFDATTPPDMRFFRSFFAATLAHLYIAWIHPFGDGNGRTARIVECAILANSGVVPWVSSNLLSDHYNRTRSRYYQRLQLSSRRREVMGFITYSAQGFVDMLREQIADVQKMQRRVAWTNYVHERMASESDGSTLKRRRRLALAMPPTDVVKRQELRRLTPDLAEMYAGMTDKTLSRDLTRLLELELIERDSASGGYRSGIHVMDAFMPTSAREPLVS